MEIILSERASEDMVYSRVSSPSNVSLGHPQGFNQNDSGNVTQRGCLVSLTLKSA